ncbi:MULTISPECIES: SDR family NAD(P)-dependent oxidoreductase [unclassified Nocardioides]|uniref:SDR family NAD(P)-dependent oxidoreductase n=1 Tax=unclassified Nocardioides TaxID=2615069 RepID=UPI001910872D|nr:MULTISPECIES: SDR family NAD(P)-dependent oxidoreductase [unclassified Nocardioides]
MTGAGRGVGAAYARLLGSRGATVVVNDLGVSPTGTDPSGGPAHEVVAEIEAAGGRAMADTRSVASPEGAEGLIEATIAAYGRVDVLIHNAGRVHGNYDELRTLNMDATHWLTEAVWPHMLEADYGRILVTTSSAGLFGTAVGTDYNTLQGYGAAKMGALGHTRSLAIRARSTGIKVNAVSPHAYTRLAAGLEQTPELAFMATHSTPERVAPGSVYLVHESCPVSGEIFAIGAGRMARIFIGETVGYVNPDLTIEDVEDNFAAIMNEAGYHVPRDMSEITAIYRKVATGQ